MKKSKKYSIMALCIILLIVGVLIIVKFNHKDKFASYYPSSETTLYDMKLNALGIEEDSLKNYHLMSSILAISAERIFIFEVKEGNMNEVKQACQTYLLKLKKQFANSSQKKLIESYTQFENGNYYVFMISNQSEEMMKSIKERFNL